MDLVSIYDYMMLNWIPSTKFYPYFCMIKQDNWSNKFRNAQIALYAKQVGNSVKKTLSKLLQFSQWTKQPQSECMHRTLKSEVMLFDYPLWKGR
jgi:hypothetical protein